MFLGSSPYSSLLYSCFCEHVISNVTLDGSSTHSPPTSSSRRCASSHTAAQGCPSDTEELDTTLPLLPLKEGNVGEDERAPSQDTRLASPPQVQQGEEGVENGAGKLAPHNGRLSHSRRGKARNVGWRDGEDCFVPIRIIEGGSLLSF